MQSQSTNQRSFEDVSFGSNLFEDKYLEWKYPKNAFLFIDMPHEDYFCSEISFFPIVSAERIISHCRNCDSCSYSEGSSELKNIIYSESKSMVVNKKPLKEKKGRDIEKRREKTRKLGLFGNVNSLVERYTGYV
jgi:hypothetical protein